MDVQEKPPGKLRTGFTTGTSATAASVAAILSIIDQKKIKSVDVILPKKDKIKISINRCEFEKNKACCSVIKDGGDDPDVTHDAEIVVDLELTSKPNSIEIDGGEGVGRVTKPGIGLEIGQAAINPRPRKMITENLTQVGKKILEKNGIKVMISVPKGKELGPKTDNPRIGIMGGISILGTSGIVISISLPLHGLRQYGNKLMLWIQWGITQLSCQQGEEVKIMQERSLNFRNTHSYRWEIFLDIQCLNVQRRASRKHMSVDLSENLQR